MADREDGQTADDVTEDGAAIPGTPDGAADSEADVQFPELRWRLAGGKLPLRDRHLRSLASYGMSAPLCAYIRTRIEWAAENDIAAHPDGVLVIRETDDDDVVISVEPSRPVPSDVAAQGVIWIAAGTTVYPQSEVISAANTLTRDLLSTLGYPVVEGAGDVDDSLISETFIVDDEFGITSCDKNPGPVTAKLIECFDKLWTLA